MSGLLRIAMWSGPRNISTALMRSWGNRPDTIVCDEPLYAHYLHATGLDHPLREEVIASQPADWKEAVAGLFADLPPDAGGKRIFYQKHMSHHLLPGMDRGWIGRLSNAFLIRDPKEMLVSLAKNLRRVTLPDTGLPQQAELFELLSGQGQVPPVLDARDVLENPRGMLGQLCRRLGVDFQESMLSWPAGRRDTDGVWAHQWYAAVERSTGFEPYRPRDEPLPAGLEQLLAECQAIYERLFEQRLM